MISPKAHSLILKWEVGDDTGEYYRKFLSRPDWPGGASGVTVGIGFDCGYYSPAEIRSTWGNRVDAPVLETLAGCSGITGSRAHAKTLAVRRSVVIPWDPAQAVFDEITVAKFHRLAGLCFPGLDDLCPDAMGALVSLVFNRGSSLKGDSRREMRAIQGLVPDKGYKGIAAQLRAMKRLWAGTAIKSLCQRREEEAQLVESCS